LNRVILAGSVIVGIAVMMSISMIAPAFASPPWKDVYVCVGSEPPGGTYEWMSVYGDCGENGLEKVDCPTKRGTVGHMEFKDLNTYDGQQQPGEQTRCHKN